MKKLRDEIKKHSSEEKAKVFERFFKTGKGQYGEGDIFIGLTVPQQRAIAKSVSKRITLNNIKTLLNSKIHEERLIGLLILVDKYAKNTKDKKIIYNFYLSNAKRVNNWDLVDLSAPNIVGDYLLKRKNKKILYKLAKSKNLWEKRIAIISCLKLIRNREFNDCLKISKILLKDKHDLIHKATGWMLREIGKKNESILKKFLKENYSELPRTTLRYAIEKFKAEERKKWLKGNFN